MFSVGFVMARRSGFSSFLVPQLLEDGYSTIPPAGEPGVSSLNELNSLKILPLRVLEHSLMMPRLS